MGALKSYRCSKGHVLKESNLYFSKGKRKCKKCANARSKANYQAKKLAKQQPTEQAA